MAEHLGENAPATRPSLRVPTTQPLRRIRSRAHLTRRSGLVAAGQTRTSVSRGTRTPHGKMPRPVRSFLTLAMVGGLVATVALPAYGAFHSEPEAAVATVQQVAVSDAQSLVVASSVGKNELSRGGYAATSAEEIAEKKAREAAAARARRAAVASVPVNVTVAPGTGEVRWPLTSYTAGDGFLSRGGSHYGVDMLAPGGAPIYASAAGVVRIASESYYGFGVAVVIDHVINGQKVSTLYAHMTYGSRQVQAGQRVEAGQLIGLVGSTGRSTANHLHMQVWINGQLTDPWAFLRSNAG